MTDFNVGDKVRGQSSNGPRVTEVGGRKTKEEDHFFEGLVAEVTSAEDSDVNEELVKVKYTKKSIEQKCFGELSDWHYASELDKVP